MALQTQMDDVIQFDDGGGRGGGRHGVSFVLCPDTRIPPIHGGQEENSSEYPDLKELANAGRDWNQGTGRGLLSSRAR